MKITFEIQENDLKAFLAAFFNFPTSNKPQAEKNTSNTDFTIIYGYTKSVEPTIKCVHCSGTRLSSFKDRMSRITKDTFVFCHGCDQAYIVKPE